MAAMRPLLRHSTMLCGYQILMEPYIMLTAEKIIKWFASSHHLPVAIDIANAHHIMVKGRSRVANTLPMLIGQVRVDTWAIPSRVSKGNLMAVYSICDAYRGSAVASLCSLRIRSHSLLYFTSTEVYFHLTLSLTVPTRRSIRWL